MSGNNNDNQENIQNPVAEGQLSDNVELDTVDRFDMSTLFQYIRQSEMSGRNLPTVHSASVANISMSRADYLNSDTVTISTDPNNRRNVSTSGQRRPRMTSDALQNPMGLQTPTTSVNRDTSQELTTNLQRDLRDSEGRAPTTSSPRRIFSNRSRLMPGLSSQSLSRGRNSTANNTMTVSVGPSGESNFGLAAEGANGQMSSVVHQPDGSRVNVRIAPPQNARQSRRTTSYKKLHEKHPDLLSKLLKSITFPKKTENSQGLLGYPSSTMRELVVENIIHDVGGTVPRLQQALEDGIESTAQHVLREVAGLSVGRDGSEEDQEPEQEPSGERGEGEEAEDEVSVQEVLPVNLPRLPNNDYLSSIHDNLASLLGASNNVPQLVGPRPLIRRSPEHPRATVSTDRAEMSEEPGQGSSSISGELQSEDFEESSSLSGNRGQIQNQQRFSFQGRQILEDFEDTNLLFDRTIRSGLALRGPHGILRIEAMPATERNPNPQTDASVSESAEIVGAGWNRGSRILHPRIQPSLHDSLASNQNSSLFFGEMLGNLQNSIVLRPEQRRSRIEAPPPSLENQQNAPQLEIQRQDVIGSSLEQITRQGINRNRQNNNFRILHPRETHLGGGINPGASRNIQLNTWQANFLLAPEGLGFQPEPTGLSQEQMCMVRKLKMVKSKKSCPVCLCGFKQGVIVRQLPCEHIYHNACIKNWLQQNPTCPSCRDNVLTHLQTQGSFRTL